MAPASGRLHAEQENSDNRRSSRNSPLKHSAVWPSMDSSCSDCRRIPRRDLLRAGGLSLFGLSCEALLRGRALAESRRTTHSADPLPARSFGRARSCILLFIWGGPAHQETWDLKPHAPAEIRGEFSPIATKIPGIEICEHFPLLARRTDKLAIVRSMT